METINFNEYTKSERYDIISSILKKMCEEGAAGNASADRFFEFYFEKFYKLPTQIRNDIVYCQRAMKTYLQVHHLVVQVFAQQADADPVQKDKFLREIEDQLYEINAENSYLTLRMREHIDDFCAVFQSHGVNCNTELVRSMISHELTPMITNTQTHINPIDVVPRETKNELMRRFFTVCQDDKTAKQKPEAQKATTPFVIETVDISDDDEDNNKDEDIQNIDKRAGKKVKQTQVMNIKTENAKPVKVLAPTQSKNERRKTGPLEPPVKNERRVSAPGTAAATIAKQAQKPSSAKPKAGNNPTTANASGMAVNFDHVKASRINLLQVLKRTRTERLKSEVKPTLKSAGVTKLQQKQQQQQQQQQQTALPKQQSVKQIEPEKTPLNDQNFFLRSLGLCTNDEYKRLATAQCQLKRRSYNKLQTH